MLWKGLQLKAFFLWLVKSLKKLVNNRIVDHLERCRLFSDFQSVFRSSRSTVRGLLTGLQLLEL